MKKLLLLGLVLLMILPLVASNDWGIAGQQTQLWSDILDGASFYNANSVRITVYAPNTSIVVNNQSMTAIATGRYFYNFTPNSSGTYYTFSEYYNTTNLIGTASSTFYVSTPQLLEDTDMGITTLIALAIIAGIILFIATNIKEEHDVMKTALYIMSFTIIIAVAGVALMNKDSCALIQNGSSVVKQCVTETGAVEIWIWRIALTIFVLLMLYVIVGIFYKAIDGLKSKGNL